MTSTRQVFMLVAAGVVGFCAAAIAQQAITSRPNPRADAAAGRVAALASSQGIPAAANAAGRFEGTEFGDPDEAVSSVRDLTAYSDLVIVGTVGAGKSFLSDDQKHINTVYEITTTRLFFDRFGQFRTGQVVRVNLRGGQVSFPNGTSATTRVVGFDGIKAGGTYVLFLHRIDDPKIAAAAGELGTYRLSWGSQAVYEVYDKGAGTVPAQRTIGLRPTGRSRSEVAKLLTTVKEDPFAEIERGVAEGQALHDATRTAR